MALSVCVRNVRATSKGGNITQGDMSCEKIEYLDEPTQVDSTISSFEPTQEIEQIVEEPIVEQIETVIIQEPVTQTLVIQQQDIFDNSLVLAETNATLKANNIELTNKVNNLEQELITVTTQEELNKILLEKEIEKQHKHLETLKITTTIHPRVDARKLWYNRYETTVKDTEIKLEKFANQLGLTYTRRDIVNGEPVYYTEPEIEEWVSYIPTSSALVREFD
jgi:hypothetical protein